MDNHSSPEREASPDWLRTFQTPLKNFKTLSSSSPSTSSHDTNSKDGSRSRMPHGKPDPYLDNDSKEEIDSAYPHERKPTIQAINVVDLDSDSDQSQRGKKSLTGPKLNKKADSVSLKNKQKKHVPHQVTDKRKEGAELQDQKDEGLLKVEGPEEDAAEGQERRPKRALSTLPLVFGDKVHRSKVLLECEGDALDVSGDVGAVGRVSVSANYNNDFLLDLKGVIYKGTIVPSNTFFVVNIGQTEAKVEAIMNDFVQLQQCANIFETETMVEGTLEGFNFDSDEDRDFVPVAGGVGEPARPGDESKEEKKAAKQKTKSNKPSKGLKGSIKKGGKGKSGKPAGKGGSTRKNVKKTTATKRAGK